jgi:hypothetical protein
MKKLNKLIIAIEVTLIVLMSIIAAYSLFGGNIRFFVLAFGLILIGVLTIVWKNWLPEIFSFAVLFTAFPCFLRHSSVDLLNRVTNHWTVGISTTLIESIGLAFVTILGYLMLKTLNAIQIEHRELIDNQAEKDEIRSVTHDKLVATSILVFFSGIISILVVLLSNSLTEGMSTYLSHFSGNIIAIGLGILLLLAACLYWLGRTLKS